MTALLPRPLSEALRVTDLAGVTDPQTFRAVTALMVLPLLVGVIFPPALPVVLVLLVPFTLSHARRLTDAGCHPVASHALLWPITGFAWYLFARIRMAGPDGLLPGFEITDEDLVLIGFTVGIYLLFMFMGYALMHLDALLLLAFSGLVGLCAVTLTCIGLFSRSRPRQRSTSAPPDARPEPASPEPWRPTPTPSPKRSRHD